MRRCRWSSNPALHPALRVGDLRPEDLRLRLASQEHTPQLVPTMSARNYADVAVTIQRWRYESFWEEIATPKVRRRAGRSNFGTINWMAMIFFAAFLRIPVVCFRRQCNQNQYQRKFSLHVRGHPIVECHLRGGRQRRCCTHGGTVRLLWRRGRPVRR